MTDDAIAQLRAMQSEMHGNQERLPKVDFEARKAQIEALDVSRDDRLRLLLDLARDEQLDSLIRGTGEMGRMLLGLAEQIVALEQRLGTSGAS